ncbi:MAG: hypothetical protein HY341_02430, partial [Candidatus Kerfeldbacteria bacterium]|nr:hypothetical protein [Candidatus Kerfeldbacteria bacterium]
VAADALHLPIQEPFFRWVDERPEDFKKESRLYQSYSPNGRRNGWQFQPDQMGTVLWALHEYVRTDRAKADPFHDLIKRLANGLVEVWSGRYFVLNTVDLWEENARQTSTLMENNFTYTLAACARGLLLANEMVPTHVWKETAMQMLAEIDEAYHPDARYFFRNHGKIADPNIDASLLGLIYPFNIYNATDERIVQTVRRMEERLVVNGGVHRFEYDYYDGEGSAQEGGGAWPLLNFWMSIYWARAGNRTKALQYFAWVLDRVVDGYHGYLPEQLFEDFRRGIYPLAWAHAMFIVAGRELKVLP